jgi:hypothetical protein
MYAGTPKHGERGACLYLLALSKETIGEAPLIKARLRSCETRHTLANQFKRFCKA